MTNIHRVPHDAMLAGYSRVDPETGEYIKPKNPEVVYGTMTHVCFSYVHPLNDSAPKA